MPFKTSLDGLNQSQNPGQTFTDQKSKMTDATPDILGYTTKFVNNQIISQDQIIEIEDESKKESTFNTNEMNSELQADNLPIEMVKNNSNPLRDAPQVVEELNNRLRYPSTKTATVENFSEFIDTAKNKFHHVINVEDQS